MDSAQGQVQNLRYVATFPLLLNIADQPTYFMALKDASELVKMYAMVNVSQYQIVATGSTVADCESNYRRMLRQNHLITEDQTDIGAGTTETLTGTLAEIRSTVVGGSSLYFLRFAGEENFTVYVSAEKVSWAVLLNVGDRVEVSCRESEDGAALREAESVTVLGGSAQPLPELPVTPDVPADTGAETGEEAAP